MILKHFEASLLGTNNYLLIDEKTNDAVLIDCTEFSPALEKELDKVNLKYILITHGHFDHVLGLNEVRQKYGAKSVMSKDDLYLTDNINHAMARFGMSFDMKSPLIDEFIKEGDVLTVGDIEIKAISTSGHSKGGMCYLVGDDLFTGDTIFKLSVGRCDLEGGSFDELKKNIQTKIFTLDEDIKIYPGHGEFSTVGFEKVNNKYD